MKKVISMLLALTMISSVTACKSDSEKSEKTGSSSEIVTTTDAPTTTEVPATTENNVKEEVYKYEKYAAMSPEKIVAEMSLEQKVSQMIQPAVYNINEYDMKANDYGSILSQTECVDAASWRDIVDEFQQAAVESQAGIPYIYGQDDVHGVNYCLNAVYFPHNIGQGAANNEELAYKVGLITADEAKLCHWLWNFSPCVAQSYDPRWGRTYESYGSDLETITKLSTAYTKGLIDGGLIACAKHYFGDGNVVYGTGEDDMLIDRGDAQLTDAEIAEQLELYQALIDAGVQTIMISHSSLNGVKMHENKEYIMKLKDEMGFEGFIVSDWCSVGNITGSSYKDKVIKSVNAGIDMLMETEDFEKAKQIIIDAVGSGKISEERINDAVTRIIKVKKEAGIFDDPLFENMKTEQKETGSMEYRAVAEQLVEESLVLLKNENQTLPLKDGTKVYITGPAADNGQAQCGGWTVSWNGAPTEEVEGVTTILEAFERYADDYGIEIITDADEADKADVVLLCVGEQSYAEWNGDTEDMELCGELGLVGNGKAIKEAKALGKPTVACIVAGRQVILPDDYEKWDSVVMCYLPGSEGKGISDVLCGCADFKGKLPSPWYGSIAQIGTDECFLERGYGLSYGNGFTARTEPAAVPDADSEKESDEKIDPMAGTNYTKGLFKDGVYVNEYANIKLNLPGDYSEASASDIKLSEDMAVSMAPDEKERIFEEARIMDDAFWCGSEYISIFFLNTKLGVPDDPDYTEEDYNNYFKGLYENLDSDAGGTFSFDSSEKVKLGEEEYTRIIMKFIYSYGGEEYTYSYAKKLDDDLMCIINISNSDTEKTPEFFEALFG